MTDKPTGVFVRLPLSDEQVLRVLDSYTGDREDTNAAMQKTILSIGTPVDSSVPIMAHIPSGDLRNFVSEGRNHKLVTVLSKSASPAYTSLVRQSDHLAKLAERDAEIARLKADNDQLKRKLTPQFFCSDILEESSMDTRESIVEEAKGYDDDFTAFTVVEMEGYARVHRSWGFYDQKNKCHWFDTETEALKASAALKGTEA